jgi:hypothetical protein
VFQGDGADAHVAIIDVPAILAVNRARDKRVKTQLEDLGWTVIEVWECQIKPDPPREVAERIKGLPVHSGKLKPMPEKPAKKRKR